MNPRDPISKSNSQAGEVEVGAREVETRELEVEACVEARAVDAARVTDVDVVALDPRVDVVTLDACATDVVALDARVTDAFDVRVTNVDIVDASGSTTDVGLATNRVVDQSAVASEVYAGDVRVTDVDIVDASGSATDAPFATNRVVGQSARVVTASEAHAGDARATDIDVVSASGLDLGLAANRVVNQSARAVAASTEVVMAATRVAAAATTFIHAASRAALAFCALGLALPLGGCPQFHNGRLSGAPTNATFVEVDGVHVRFREAGAGPAVVLVHGYGASSESWASVIPKLSPRHRVIAIDLKGFGWTSRPPGDYSPAAQAKLVWAVLDQLKVTDVAIVGHSWGSSVSLAMAVAQPARVRRVALYAAYVYDDQVPSFFRWAEKPGLGEMLFGAYYRERIEDRAALAFYDERFVTQDKVERVEADLARPGTVAAALATARRHHFGPLHRALRAFDRPVLLLWGENDQVTPIRFGHRLVEELANAELKTYARCGHMPMVEAHNQSTRDLAEFLAKDIASATPPTPTAPSGPASEGGASTGGASTGASGGSASVPRGTDTNATSTRGASTGASVPRGTDAGAPTGRASMGGASLVPRGTDAGASSNKGAADTVTIATTDGASSAGGAASTGGGAADTVTSTRTGGGLAVDSTTVDSIIADGSRVPDRREPDLVPRSHSPVGADLAAIGIELAPRQYASPREGTQFVVHGLVRAREHGLFNLDLDRGLDTRGQPVFPVPLDGGQKLEHGDIRARTDLALYTRGVGLAVKARIDWLDNVSLGGNPDLSNGSPATSSGQRPTAVVVKRAWGEALLPVGTLAVGRMGAHFGLGIAAHGGDCEDCDHGDAADRIAFATPLLGHVFAIAWDFAARGPFTRSKDDGHDIVLEPSAAVSGPTIAVLKVHSPATRARRAAAGLVNFEYGIYASFRLQETDVPASYLPAATPAGFDADDVVARGFSAQATGAWLRVATERMRVEAEAAVVLADIEQPSLVPGAEITTPVTSRQIGAAIESDFDYGARFGLDAGFASGDDAPGFGAFPKPGEMAPPPGSFDGPQADLPRDRTVDNFRFRPDYRVDQILFRELIGTITDAIYVKPHVRAAVLSAGDGQLEVGASVVASWAVEANSTPSGARDLGIEIDPELRYAHRDGFAANLAIGWFIPGGAFDNTNLEAKSAQVVRGRIAWVF